MPIIGIYARGDHSVSLLTKTITRKKRGTHMKESTRKLTPQLEI